MLNKSVQSRVTTIGQLNSRNNYTKNARGHALMYLDREAIRLKNCQHTLYRQLTITT